MNITFQGKYKSITDFDWTDIPKFVVITGPNGTGKSQLLDLIYNSIIKPKVLPKAFINSVLSPNEITFLKGEWQLSNTSYVDLATLQNNTRELYKKFQENRFYNTTQDLSSIRRNYLFNQILKKTGKKDPSFVTEEEFNTHFPEIYIESEYSISQRIADIFYNYRVDEIELLSKGLSPDDIKEMLGQKPWVVMRQIIAEAKLPFDINDPREHGFRDMFKLVLTHTILNEEVNFSDLSSGEKVLISLVFYLYNSQEKNIFPKLLLLDEPDAHLHPTMSQQFLNVIKNVLVDKYDVQVIMTTHSPSTVMLAPDESIFEMSRVEPRIKKSQSKNHSVSLLTAGLVYVGSGTKYFLVEDEADVKFYSHVHDILTKDIRIDSDVPLVFIPSSTKTDCGGKSVVQNWVTKLQSSGLNGIIQGLIDEDSGNETSKGIFKIERYSIENYLADPLVVYATLLDKGINPPVENINLRFGEFYKLKFLSVAELQQITDTILNLAHNKLKTAFPRLTNSDFELVDIVFDGNIVLKYPKWLLKHKGKAIINQVYGETFSNINFGTLFTMYRKLNLIPHDLIDKIIELKNSHIPSQ